MFFFFHINIYRRKYGFVIRVDFIIDDEAIISKYNCPKKNHLPSHFIIYRLIVKRKVFDFIVVFTKNENSKEKHETSYTRDRLINIFRYYGNVY